MQDPGREARASASANALLLLLLALLLPLVGRGPAALGPQEASYRPWGCRTCTVPVPALPSTAAQGGAWVEPGLDQGQRARDLAVP